MKVEYNLLTNEKTAGKPVDPNRISSAFIIYQKILKIKILVCALDRKQGFLLKISFLTRAIIYRCMSLDFTNKPFFKPISTHSNPIDIKETYKSYRLKLTNIKM